MKSENENKNLSGCRSSFMRCFSDAIPGTGWGKGGGSLLIQRESVLAISVLGRFLMMTCARSLAHEGIKKA